jgi:allene oxide cyclase
MWKFSSAVAIVATLASASVALAGGGSADHGAHQAVKLAGKTVQLNLVDAGEPGFTLGDQVAFSDDLRTLDGKPAGFDGGVCTLVRIADAKTQTGTAQCQVTYSLDGGQITTQALGTLTNGGFVGTQNAAITGGTGRYRAARGESQLEFVRPGELKITLALR